MNTFLTESGCLSFIRRVEMGMTGSQHSRFIFINNKLSFYKMKWNNYLATTLYTRGFHMNMHTNIKTPTPAEQQDSSLIKITFSL